MAVAGSPFIDGWFWSLDGLRLHFRDYAGRTDRPALVCLGGLTRTVRDFEGLAARLAGDWRVIAIELRGRGESAYAKDPLTYVPLTYLQDIGAALAAARVDRFVAIGSGLGGMLALLLTVTRRASFAGVVLNDIGPLAPAGGTPRLRTELTRATNWPTWIHAARDLAATHGAAYPGWTTADWLAFAKRVARVSPPGRIGLDHDARIADAFRLPGGEAALDLWPAFEGLRGVPCLSLRGEMSDGLDARTQAEMAARLPGLRTVTVAGVGHAPTLDEPESVAAVAALLAAVG